MGLPSYLKKKDKFLDYLLSLTANIIDGFMIAKAFVK